MTRDAAKSCCALFVAHSPTGANSDRANVDRRRAFGFAALFMGGPAFLLGLSADDFRPRDRQQSIHQRGERLIFPRRVCHVGSIVTVFLSLAFASCALAQSRPQSIQGTRNQATDDQNVRRDAALDAIAVELRAIREQEGRIEQQRASREAEPGPPIYSNWVLIVITGGAVIAAFLTLGALGKQLRANVDAASAARDSADVAKRTLEVGHRAYLSIVGVWFDNFGPGRIPNLILELKNDGRVPATITNWGTTILTQEELPRLPPGDINWQPHSAVIFPGMTNALGASGEGSAMTPFTTDEWSEIEAGTYSINVYGGIRYDAGFGITGEVGFGYHFVAALPTQSRLERRFVATETAGYNYAR
jgi:hypothetical protein